MKIARCNTCYNNGERDICMSKKENSWKINTLLSYILGLGHKFSPRNARNVSHCFKVLPISKLLFTILQFSVSKSPFFMLFFTQLTKLNKDKVIQTEYLWTRLYATKYWMSAKVFSDDNRIQWKLLRAMRERKLKRENWERIFSRKIMFLFFFHYSHVLKSFLDFSSKGHHLLRKVCALKDTKSQSKRDFTIFFRPKNTLKKENTLTIPHRVSICVVEWWRISLRVCACAWKFSAFTT